MFYSIILLVAGLAHSNTHKGQTESVNEWMEQGRELMVCQSLHIISRSFPLPQCFRKAQCDSWSMASHSTLIIPYTLWLEQMARILDARGDISRERTSTGLATLRTCLPFSLYSCCSQGRCIMCQPGHDEHWQTKYTGTPWRIGKQQLAGKRQFFLH